MRKLLLVLPLISMLSCGNAEEIREEKERIVYGDLSNTVRIIQIDGCEYLLFRGYEKGGITHKANCKNIIHDKK